jgi:hypothetical protein
VKGQHIRIDRLVEARMNPIQQGMRRFVRDDVMRKTGENEGARSVVGVLDADWKVSEQQRLFSGL